MSGDWGEWLADIPPDVELGTFRRAELRDEADKLILLEVFSPDLTYDGHHESAPSNNELT